MSDFELNEVVGVRGSANPHTVVSIIGRTSQVHIRCNVTGVLYEYVLENALIKIPTMIELENDFSLYDNDLINNTPLNNTSYDIQCGDIVILKGYSIRFSVVNVSNDLLDIVHLSIDVHNRLTSHTRLDRISPNAVTLLRKNSH